ncbi:putative SWIM zinc finger domain-containing protein, partial [Balamuthia mandrillaris]
MGNIDSTLQTSAHAGTTQSSGTSGGPPPSTTAQSPGGGGADLFSLSSLLSTLNEDLERLQELEESWFNLLDDEWVVTRHLGRLESSQTRWASDDELLAKLKRRKEKGRDIENALALLCEQYLHLNQTQIKWLTKEIASICAHSTSSFDTLLSLRKKHLENSHLALLRSHMRLGVIRRCWDKRAEEELKTRRGEFVLNLFNNCDSEEAGVLKVLLARLAELPNLHLSLSEEVANFLELQAAAKEAMPSDVEDKSKGKEKVETSSSALTSSSQDKPATQTSPVKKSLPSLQEQEEHKRSRRLSVKEEKEEEKQFRKSLLYMLTNHVWNRAKQAISRAATSYQQPEEEASQATSSSKDKDKDTKSSSKGDLPYFPSLTLLTALQKDLIRQVVCCKDNQDPAFRMFLLYVRLTLELAIEFQDAVVATNLFLTRNSPGKSMDAYLLRSIDASPLNQLLRYLLLAVSLFCSPTLSPPSTVTQASSATAPYVWRYFDFRDELSENMLPLLVEFMKRLDSFNIKSTTITAEEMDYLDTERVVSSSCYGNAMAPAMEVESPHKYYPDADEEKVITIPGATHLCVTFDPRCSTKDNGDWLQLYRGPFQTEPILTKFCGPSTNWPKVPIIVPGDTVVFHFHSNSFQTYWGYRCIVTPLVLGQCRSWLYELERTVAHLTANSLGCMLIGPRVTSLEKRYEPLLQSPLFSGGWEEEQMFEEDSSSSKKTQDRMEAEEEEEEEEGGEQAEEGERRKSRSRAASNNRRKGRKRKKADEAAEFLEDFIKDENSMGAKMFLTLTRKHLPMSPTDMMGGPHVALATRYYIATNVKHLGLAAAAMNSETRTEEQTSQLVEICREAQKVRRWIVQTSQHRLLQEEERLEEERELARQRGETLPDKEKERQPEFADPNAKYFELSNQVIENMKLLLRLKSCTSTPGLSSSTSLGHGGTCGEEEEFLTTEEKFISSMSSALSPTMSRRLNKKKGKQQRNFVSLRQSQESQEDKSSLQLWKSLFETWQALQSHHRHHHQQGRGFLTNSKGRRQRRQNLFATLPVHIFSFIQNEGESGSTSTLIELLNRRLTRARGRIAALNALYELLTSLKLTSVQHDMLKVVGPALVTMRHYLKDVLACGPAFEKKLEVSFVHLYSYLAKLLVNESLDPTTRALSLQAWCLSFMPKDHPFLMHVQIFDTLRKLTFQGLHASSSSQQYLTESEKEEVLSKGKQHLETNAEKSCDKKLDQRFKHLASLTYRLLVIVCVGQNKGSRETNNNGANNKEQTTMITDAKSKEEEEKVTDKLDTFQQHVLDVIFSDITGSIAKLGQKRKNFVSPTMTRGGEQDDETEFENGGGEVSSQIATNYDHKIDDYHQEERFCYSTLLLLGVISIREGEGEVSTVLALASSSSSSASSSSSSASPSSSPMLSSRAATLAVPSSATSTLSPKINLRRSASALSTSSSGVMTSPKVLKVFLQLLRLGTPRIQRLVLRLLRHVLPKIDPALFITNAELRQELRLYKDWDELFCCSRKDLLHDFGTTSEENGSMMELEQGTKTDEDDLTPEMAFIHCFFDVIGRALEIQIHTDRAASSSSSSSSSPSSSSSMFSGLLAMNIETEEEGTANISLIQNPLSPSKTLSPSLQNYRDGQVKFNEISEMVMLFRHLLNTTTSSSSYIPQWTMLLQQAMLQAIQNIPSMVDSATQTIRSSFYNDLLKSNSNNNHKILWRAFAALSIIGGHTDRMRVGARVATKTEGAQQESGTVTFYDRDSAEARVIFDSNMGQIIKVSSEMLRPIPEIAANTERFPITADVIPSVILFAVEPLQTKSRRSDLLSSSSGTGGNKNSTHNSRLSKIAKAQVKPKLKPKAKKDKSSSQVKKEPWSCPACTFINIPAAQNCEICNTANPAMGPLKSAFLKKQESDSSIESSASDSHEEFIDVDNIVFEEDETLSDDEEEVDAGHCAADLLFHQLRSRVLKYLCTALADKNGSSTSELYAQKLFPTLLKMAISPTQLDEFHSLENMEKIEDRLWELLYGIRDQFYPTQHHKEEGGRKDETIGKANEKTMKKFVFKDEIYAVRDRWNRTSRLKYSPLNLLQFHLPTAMDRGTARNIAFSLRNPRLMMGQCPDPQSIGLAKANYSIPNTVPAFYFEVKILGEKRNNSGASSSEGHKYPRVAIGLYRDGMPLFGSPGNNSYCFQADEGATYHNSDLPVDPAYGPRCGVGDVIGCGWSHRLGILFFTKNGQTLGPAFDNVNGRFSPALWIATDRCRVVVNFGQERFYYNYMEILPENYVEQLVENAEQTSSLTPVEIKRRTDAEMLQSMTPMFPLELCVIALEKSNDDMQVAANWLFENGFRELERMEAESLERSRQEDAERQEQWLQQLLVQNGGENSDDIPPEILSAIAASSSSSSSATSSTTATAAMEEEEPPQEQEAEDEDEFTNFEREEEDELFQTSSESQEGGRYLDDEIGADAPVQIARTQRQGRELETVTIKEITPGMLLCVSPSAAVNSQTPSWHPSMDMFAGRTGVVTAVNPDLLMVELRFFDADTCSKRSFWFSFQVLEKPRDMWQDPCVELCTAAPVKIKNALVEVETALAILKVRRAMLSLIAEWPTFPIAIDSQESMKSVMDLLKLASAEFLYSGAESSGR